MRPVLTARRSTASRLPPPGTRMYSGRGVFCSRAMRSIIPSTRSGQPPPGVLLVLLVAARRPGQPPQGRPRLMDALRLLAGGEELVRLVRPVAGQHAVEAAKVRLGRSGHRRAHQVARHPRTTTWGLV